MIPDLLSDESRTDRPTANAARNFRSTAYERAADEWYVEPAWCVEQLAGAVDFDGDLIWDPACGLGTVPTVFEARGHDVVGSDLIHRGYEGCVARHDFLIDDPRLVVSGSYSIVTNPPFKLAVHFARVAMLATRARRVAIVQQLSFLASRARHELFTEFPPSDVLILSRRPSMPPGHMIEEMGVRAFRGGTTDFCWIVWTRPHDRETRMRWLAPEG